MKSKTLAERFFSKVSQTETGCHEWQGCLMPNGYGQIHLNGKTAYAHRVAWELATGKEPSDFVLHRCDNRKCVNPEHLFLGTFDDNMADMTNKLRQAHGVRNGHAKLTEKQVLEIRAASETNTAIARDFGVSQALVSMIKSRRIWKHV